MEVLSFMGGDKINIQIIKKKEKQEKKVSVMPLHQNALALDAWASMKSCTVGSTHSS